MEPAKTKVKIESKEPYIRNFNGQQATATEKKGVSGRQMFDLATGGGAIFLSPQDYAPIV